MPVESCDFALLVDWLTTPSKKQHKHQPMLGLLLDFWNVSHRLFENTAFLVLGNVRTVHNSLSFTEIKYERA
jgi:hypothetical protein